MNRVHLKPDERKSLILSPGSAAVVRVKTNNTNEKKCETEITYIFADQSLRERLHGVEMSAPGPYASIYVSDTFFRHVR